MLTLIALSIVSAVLLGVGAAVQGLFALAVIGLALLVLTAAWGLSLQTARHAPPLHSAHRLHHG